ncbi:DUF4465 domain-containing protein [Dysgonomonas sp. 25]|uniref:DUF4465 domain-containing protein n=1 Tax=Dysgonomonas sp. 25 TaxID=2302933 RepID=UPI0013D530D5|nr:DUF4465 domain-containing protein [Dysgonomonas sp. 25]NDV69661.1 DUF4465 domain-containing protein [Dysgonomonas sp. 25]
MKKVYLFLLLLTPVLLGFTSCSDDDTPGYSTKTISITEPENGYILKEGQTLNINPGIEMRSGDIVTWSIDDKVVSDRLVLEYTPMQAGTHKATLMVVNVLEYTKTTGEVEITVLPEDVNYVRLDLTNFDLSDGVATAGGKYWSGTYDDSNVHVESQIFGFSHTSMNFGGGYAFWDGFTVSNSNDNSQQADFITNQFACMAKGGVKGESTPYLVSFLMAGMRPDRGEFSETRYTSWVKIADEENTYKAVGMYVCNSAWPYYCIVNGSGSARQFVQGDYFVLRAYGVDADNTISDPVEFYLADYRSDDPSEWTVNDSWEWMDLSPLGKVKYIFFKLESTDSDPIWGMNTSAYFCMDQLTVDKVD